MTKNRVKYNTVYRPSLDSRIESFVEILRHANEVNDEQAKALLHKLKGNAERRYYYLYFKFKSEENLKAAYDYFIRKYNFIGNPDYPLILDKHYWLAPAAVRAYMRKHAGIRKVNNLRLGLIHVHPVLISPLRKFSLMKNDGNKARFRIAVLDAILNKIGDGSQAGDSVFDTSILPRVANYGVDYRICVVFMRSLECGDMIQRIAKGQARNIPATYRVTNPSLLKAVRDLFVAMEHSVDNEKNSSGNGYAVEVATGESE
ncbi:MAG: hypothetical protein D6735_03360 [Acidobacteria bacterium]|jgi:hypothetical protein|nr:MAG: hypothetical protein D6735_03360 [Acidobacteriota bacterium]